MQKRGEGDKIACKIAYVLNGRSLMPVLFCPEVYLEVPPLHHHTEPANRCESTRVAGKINMIISRDKAIFSFTDFPVHVLAMSFAFCRWRGADGNSFFSCLSWGRSSRHKVASGSPILRAILPNPTVLGILSDDRPMSKGD